MKRYLFLAILAGWGNIANAQQATRTFDKDVLMQYFENQEYAGAANYLQLTIGGDSTNLNYLSLLGYAYYMSNQPSSAARCYSQILRIDSGNTTAWNYLGKINLRKGDKTRALNFFCRLVDLKPGVAGYYKQLATLWDQLGNAPAAAYYYRLSYLANPNDPDVVASLAGHWIGQKMYDKADSILNISLQQDSLQAGVIEAAILSAYQQKKYKNIFPLANRLKRMNDIRSNPFFYTAVAYFFTHQYQQCVETCDFMIVHHLESRSILYLEAMAYKKQKKYKKSLAMLNGCIGLALSKDADNYFSDKADIYEKLHQYHHAIRQYDTAYYIFQNPLQLYNKARIYDANLKRPKTALHYYNDYLHHRKKPLPPDERPVLKYVNERVKALKDWEKRVQLH